MGVLLLILTDQVNLPGLPKCCQIGALEIQIVADSVIPI